MMTFVTRREFLKAGVVGSLLLASAGQVSSATNAESEEAAMLAAVAGAVLGGVLPADPAQRNAALVETVKGVRRAIAGLSAA